MRPLKAYLANRILQKTCSKLITVENLTVIFLANETADIQLPNPKSPITLGVKFFSLDFLKSWKLNGAIQ